MMMHDAVYRARLDNEGCVVSIESRLALLNSAAGGGLGLPLALPSLAMLARLCRRLGIVIARAATVADGEDDLDLWVRACPASEGVELEVSGWRHRDPGVSSQVEDAADFDRAEADFTWETDAAMMLTAYSGDAALIGEAMTRLFDFSVGDGLIQVLGATANRGTFADQPARLIPAGRAALLSGRARVDISGGFAGLSGTGRFVEDEHPAADAGVDSSFGDQFALRLERALRTPLQRIVANADSIGAQTDGPVRAEYVDYAHDIASAARHLMGLVDDLVDLSAIERPDFRVEAELIDLADVARRAAGLLSVRAADADVRIERPADDARLPAAGEFRRALQIMVNLVGNAVRYSPRDARVAITLERGDTCVSVGVVDEGRGIAPDDQARIFDKFGRVDPSEPGGNGLGLYIARRLARAMGGDIAVESAIGQGARFTLTLPAG